MLFHSSIVRNYEGLFKLFKLIQLRVIMGSSTKADLPVHKPSMSVTDPTCNILCYLWHKLLAKPKASMSIIASLIHESGMKYKAGQPQINLNPFNLLISRPVNHK